MQDGVQIRLLIGRNARRVKLKYSRLRRIELHHGTPTVRSGWFTYYSNHVAGCRTVLSD